MVLLVSYFSQFGSNLHNHTNIYVLPEVLGMTTVKKKHLSYHSNYRKGKENSKIPNKCVSVF